MGLNVIIVLILLIALIMIGIGAFMTTLYHKVEQGQALIKSGAGGTEVSLNGMIIIPILHKAEYIDITLKKITLNHKNHDRLVTKDGEKVSIKANFFVKIDSYDKAIIKVARAVGCENAGNVKYLHELFEAKFSQALKVATKEVTYEDLEKDLIRFQHMILNIIGQDLNGFILDDCVIEHIEK